MTLDWFDSHFWQNVHDEIETAVTQPPNREGKTIGVGEEIEFWVEGVSGNSITWELEHVRRTDR